MATGTVRSIEQGRHVGTDTVIVEQTLYWAESRKGDLCPETQISIH